MQIIDKLFYVGPYAMVIDFDTGDQELAISMIKKQMVSEGVEFPLPSYHSDPLIIRPCAIIIADQNGLDDIVTHNTNHIPSWIIWEGMDNAYYMVQPQYCYDVDHTRPLI